MVQKARDNSVPVDTIQRAIKRGTGEEEGVIYEPVTYEGYAAGGVAVIVQALTDNRNRTSAEIKNMFSRNGGSFAEPGAVSWQFERKGIVRGRQVPPTRTSSCSPPPTRAPTTSRTSATRWQVTTPPTELHAVRTAIEERGLHGEVVRPHDDPDHDASSSTQESQAKTVLRLMDALEDHDDVEAVYANFDIPDSVLEAVSA